MLVFSYTEHSQTYGQKLNIVILDGHFIVAISYYTPILDLTILDLTDFLEITKCNSALLKTDQNFFPGVVPGAPGVSKILGLTKSLTNRSVRKIHQLRYV